MQKLVSLLYRGALGGLLLSFLAAAFCFFVIPTDRIMFRPWSGYTLLVLDNPIGPEKAAVLQQLPGVTGLVSVHTTPVSFTTFDGMATVPVEQLDRRLDEIDPRFDPYLRSVGRYFTAPGGKVLYYLKTNRHPLRLYLALRRIHFESDWRLPSFQPAFLSLLFMLFVIYLGVILFLKKTAGLNWLLLLASIPWALRLFSGDVLDLLGFFLTCPLLLVFLEYYTLYVQKRILHETIRWEDSIRIRFLVLGAMFCVLQFALIASDPTLLTKHLLSLGTTLLLFPLISLRLLAIRHRRAHNVFGPVSILRRLKPRARWYRRSRTLSLLFLALMLLSLPLAAALKKLNGVQLPIPEGLGQPITWANLNARVMFGPTWLPNLDDYLSHKAYQEGMIFGRDYRFPFPGERLYMSSYLRSAEGKIVKTYRVIKRYQPSWVQESLQRSSVGTIQRLLLDQDQLVEVALLSEFDLFLLELLWMKIVLVCIFLISFVILGDFHLTPILLYGTRNFVLRRYPL